MTCEEEPEVCILKTHQLLSEAQLLMGDIEEMLNRSTTTNPSRRRRHRMESPGSVEGDGETLVIEGFRFESAASREDLRRLNSQAGAG